MSNDFQGRETRQFLVLELFLIFVFQFWLAFKKTIDLLNLSQKFDWNLENWPKTRIVDTNFEILGQKTKFWPRIVFIFVFQFQNFEIRLENKYKMASWLFFLQANSLIFRIFLSKFRFLVKNFEICVYISSF